MIRFQRHIPSFCDIRNAPPDEEYETLEDLLAAKSDMLEQGEVWARADSHTLMTSFTDRPHWWVLGYVDGVDLCQYLPYYSSCYKLQGDEVWVVKILSPSWVWNGKSGSDELYVVEKSDGERFSLAGLTCLGDDCAWFDKEELEFIRYATQEELDRINKFRESV